MSKFLIRLVTILCPGIIFFILEKPISMIIAIALQASVLGWIPAMFWARKAWLKDLKEKAPVKIAPTPAEPEMLQTSAPPMGIETKTTDTESNKTKE
jgi:hypothetical protein